MYYGCPCIHYHIAIHLLATGRDGHVPTFSSRFVNCYFQVPTVKKEKLMISILLTPLTENLQQQNTYISLNLKKVSCDFKQKKRN